MPRGFAAPERQNAPGDVRALMNIQVAREGNVPEAFRAHRGWDRYKDAGECGTSQGHSKARQGDVELMTGERKTEQNRLKT